MQITMRMKLPATVNKKKDWYISCCPILDVYSQGKTKKKALDNLEEALKLFFISCFERGTLDQVMSESGFVPIEKTNKKLVTIPKRYETIDVPLPFMIKPHHSTRDCHA